MTSFLSLCVYIIPAAYALSASDCLCQSLVFCSVTEADAWHCREVHVHICLKAYSAVLLYINSRCWKQIWWLNSSVRGQGQRVISHISSCTPLGLGWDPETKVCLTPKGLLCIRPRVPSCKVHVEMTRRVQDKVSVCGRLWWDLNETYKRPKQSYIKFDSVSFLHVTLHHIAILHTLFRILYLVVQAIPPSAYLLFGLLFVLSFKCLNNTFPNICMQKELWYERSHYFCLMLASAACVYARVLFTEAEREEQDWSMDLSCNF